MVNRVTGLFFLIFFLIFALLIPWQISSKGVPPNSSLPIYPQFFPVILAIFGSALSISVIMLSFLKSRLADEHPELPTRANLSRVGGAAALMCFHFFTFNYLGYLLSTALGLVLFMAFLGLRDIKSYIFVIVILPPAIYFLFKKVLYVAFPAGFLGF